ncbi:DUF177 domain-containing protein [Hymenobacter sp. H14-R3]|uniref:YceD family protein n=1 Tax=Hymenobacter sp. H14-R3 TaxID=3046308 RepID=UPI0024BB726C|nr:DUF177 domain-containing protein [Hymenobacter sp. H14-R3]MDJ0363908.1 DUF177 domain-containing protein [Hymenobacter sp. H14-R3]
MKKDLQFELPIARLSLKTHNFAFELDHDFFEQFDPKGEFIADGDLHADVVLDKGERVITINSHITGTVRLTCDRSLDEYDQPLDIENKLLVRYSDEAKELDDDVMQITPDTMALDIAQHLYDYIGLALPMKKLHPRFQNEADDDPDAETKLIFSTRPPNENPDDDEPADPRWAALKNLN